MRLGRRRRGQTFSIDIIIALGIFALLFTAMERMQTEVEKDRVEWETVYDLKMVSDDYMTAMVDSTPNSYQYGVSYYDDGMGIDRLNSIDVEALGALAPFIVNPTFFSPLMTTEGSLGYGWRLSMYVCKDEDMGADRDIALPVDTKWFEDPSVPRCVVTNPVLEDADTCWAQAARYREMDGIYHYTDGALLRKILRSDPPLFLLDGAGQVGGACNRENPGGMCLHVTTTEGYTPGDAGSTQVSIDNSLDSFSVLSAACRSGNCPNGFDSGWFVIDLIPDESDIGSDTLEAAVTTYLGSNRGFPASAGQHATGMLQMTMDGASEVYSVDCGEVEARLRVHKGQACEFAIVSFMDYVVAQDGDADTDPATPGTPTWRTVFKRERASICNDDPPCYANFVCNPGQEPIINTAPDAGGVTVTMTSTTFGRTGGNFAGATIDATYRLTTDCRLGIQFSYSFTGDVPERAYGMDVGTDTRWINPDPSYWADDLGEYLNFWDDAREECLLPIVPNQATCEGATVAATWSAAPTPRCLVNAIANEAACNEVVGTVWSGGECRLRIISDQQTCEAAGNTAWTEDLPDPRCVATGVVELDCGDDDVGGTWLNDECVLTAAGDLQACEHLTTAWVWNDPGEGPGGRCTVTSVGMTMAFCEGDAVGGEWDLDMATPGCVVHGIEDKGSCETFCFDPQFQPEPFMIDPDPDLGEEEPPEGMANCQSPEFGCISSAQAKYGQVSVNRVVAPRGGRGVGVLSLEVWK